MTNLITITVVEGASEEVLREPAGVTVEEIREKLGVPYTHKALLNKQGGNPEQVSDETEIRGAADWFLEFVPQQGAKGS